MLSHVKNQTVNLNDGVAPSKNPRKCAYHVTFDLDLDLHTYELRKFITLNTLGTPVMQVHLVTIVCKFGGDRAICMREEAICAKVYRRTDGQTTDAAPLH